MFESSVIVIKMISLTERIKIDSKNHLPVKTAAFVSSPTPFGHSPIGDSGATDTLIRVAVGLRQCGVHHRAGQCLSFHPTPW